MSGDKDDFFIGWSPTAPVADRRFMLAAALGLVAAGAGLAYALGAEQDEQGPGVWRQEAVRSWSGHLVRRPYPMLRFADESGAWRTALLGTYGKTSVERRLSPELTGPIIVQASPIERESQLMLAVADGPDAIRSGPALPPPPTLETQDLGTVMLVGEILDAKCWFGAMKPGAGKTHKSCAALCARGGLPLAFCPGADCAGVAEAPLFLDGGGAPHGRSILPLVADPVRAIGLLMRVDGVLEFRAALGDIRRL